MIGSLYQAFHSQPVILKAYQLCLLMWTICLVCLLFSGDKIFLVGIWVYHAGVLVFWVLGDVVKE